ncbi:hypothetical protein AruPA_21530, partial [Acidiphilium sp. PA]|uniref:hypothetical protein n=1 Tax=Acidiphilium sp. PA TaxID=2871705 RepID=UPI002242E95A
NRPPSRFFDAAIPMIHPHPCIPTLGRESQRIGAIPRPMENGGIPETRERNLAATGPIAALVSRHGVLGFAARLAFAGIPVSINNIFIRRL